MHYKPKKKTEIV